ncbi:MAG: hypothetical protein HKN81_01980 [Gammaproteobacteria bacterium]|nr:hypothetical protein [Gammaproteobacteria bacterium]
MAAEVITGASILVGGVDLSTVCKAFTLKKSYDVKQKQAFQDAAISQSVGLATVTLDCDWYGDFEAGGLNATIDPLAGSSAAYVCKKDSGAVAATNPSYSGNVIIADWTAMGLEVGEYHEFSTSWVGDGDWTKAVA